MSKFGLLGNYSADPSLGKMGGLTGATGAATGTATGAGGMDIGSIIGSLLPMLLSGMGQGKSETPQQSIIGGEDRFPVQVQMPQFNRPPSYGQIISQMLQAKRGY